MSIYCKELRSCQDVVLFAPSDRFYYEMSTPDADNLKLLMKRSHVIFTDESNGCSWFLHGNNNSWVCRKWDGKVKGYTMSLKNAETVSKIDTW